MYRYEVFYVPAPHMVKDQQERRVYSWGLCADHDEAQRVGRSLIMMGYPTVWFEDILPVLKSRIEDEQSPNKKAVYSTVLWIAQVESWLADEALDAGARKLINDFVQDLKVLQRIRAMRAEIKLA